MPRAKDKDLNSTHSFDLESALLSMAWVQVLPDKSKERLIADSFDKLYAARELIARKAELSSYWIGVVDGLLKVSTVMADGRSVMFTAVPDNSWVGEGSVIKREPRRYDLMALRTSRVIHVPRATFMWLLETSNEFSRYIIDHLNERVGQFLAMREVSQISDPARRVAGAICGLFNPVLCPKAGPMLNISQEEIGELAGLSRPTINLALKQLKKLRLVNPEYGHLLVVDLERLRQFASLAGSHADAVSKSSPD